jgi:hypothetical protein
LKHCSRRALLLRAQLVPLLPVLLLPVPLSQLGQRQRGLRLGQRRLVPQLPG